MGNILLDMSVLESRMFVDFLHELYTQIFRYVLPLLDRGRNLVYCVEHMEVINNNLLLNLELDEVDTECALSNYRPLDSSI